jgi:hypothetical protein
LPWYEVEGGWREEVERRKEEGKRRKEEGGRRKEEGGRRKEGVFLFGRRKEEGGRRKEEGGRRKEEGGRRKEEGGRRKEEGGRRKEEGRKKERKEDVVGGERKRGVANVRFSHIPERAEMSLQSLCTKMTGQHLGPFSLPTLLSILYDVSCGMHFIHSHDIAHRDMNLGNFLIFSDFTVKVF